MRYPSRTYHSRGLAAWRWKGLRAELGDGHVATRAARARLDALAGEGVARIAAGEERVELRAFLRESTAPGYNNRHTRERDRRGAHDQNR